MRGAAAAGSRARPRQDGAHLAVPVVDPQMHAGGHEQQQGLLLTQLLAEALQHLGPLVGSLEGHTRS